MEHARFFEIAHKTQIGKKNRALANILKETIVSIEQVLVLGGVRRINMFYRKLWHHGEQLFEIQSAIRQFEGAKKNVSSVRSVEIKIKGIQYFEFFVLHEIVDSPFNQNILSLEVRDLAQALNCVLAKDYLLKLYYHLHNQVVHMLVSRYFILFANAFLGIMLSYFFW